MGTSVWAFRVRRTQDYDEGPEPRLIVNPAADGTEFVRSLDSTAARLIAAGVVVLDGTSGHAYSDWETFYRSTVAYGATSFLYKCYKAAHREISGESLGTAVGGVGDTFTFARKFIDEDTIVVRDSSGDPISSSDYTFSGNNTAPQIATGAGFPAGATTADYEYYHQVRLTQTRAVPRSGRQDHSLAEQGVHYITFGVREVVPGGSLA